MSYIEYSNSATKSGFVESPVTATPAVTSALHDLAEATRVLAAASETYIIARSALQDAQGMYAKLLDVTVKEREQAGV